MQPHLLLLAFALGPVRRRPGCLGPGQFLAVEQGTGALLLGQQQYFFHGEQFLAQLLLALEQGGQILFQGPALAFLFRRPLGPVGPFLLAQLFPVAPLVKRFLLGN